VKKPVSPRLSSFSPTVVACPERLPTTSSVIVERMRSGAVPSMATVVRSPSVRLVTSSTMRLNGQSSMIAFFRPSSTAR
jgi:hypothetical protein